MVIHKLIMDMYKNSGCKKAWKKYFSKSIIMLYSIEVWDET